MKILALLSCALLISCGSIGEKKQYLEFIEKKSYPKTYSIYQDKDLLALSDKGNSKIVVDTKGQRLRLVVGGQTAIDSPTTTGSSRKRDRNTGRIKNKSTPKGKFPIMGKLRKKRSTIFGRLYRDKKLVYSGDKRNYKGKYDDYKGAALNYWMRLTNDGIGIHASSGIKRRPASNGCIRVPHKVAPKLFSRVKRGTLVEIQ